MVRPPEAFAFHVCALVGDTRDGCDALCAVPSANINGPREHPAAVWCEAFEAWEAFDTRPVSWTPRMGTSLLWQALKSFALT